MLSVLPWNVLRVYVCSPPLSLSRLTWLLFYFSSNLVCQSAALFMNLIVNIVVSRLAVVCSVRAWQVIYPPFQHSSSLRCSSGDTSHSPYPSCCCSLLVLVALPCLRGRTCVATWKFTRSLGYFSETDIVTGVWNVWGRIVESRN